MGGYGFYLQRFHWNDDAVADDDDEFFSIISMIQLLLPSPVRSFIRSQTFALSTEKSKHFLYRFCKNIFAEQVGEKSDQKRRKLQFRDLHSGKERFLIIAMLG